MRSPSSRCPGSRAGHTWLVLRWPHTGATALPAPCAGAQTWLLPSLLSWASHSRGQLRCSPTSSPCSHHTCGGHVQSARGSQWWLHPSVHRGALSTGRALLPFPFSRRSTAQDDQIPFDRHCNSVCLLALKRLHFPPPPLILNFSRTFSKI